MSQTGVVSWSQTAASNATADSNVNFAEGMAPSQLNDSCRSVMSSAAKYRDDQAGALTTGGTNTAYTLTTNQVFSALSVLAGQKLKVRFNATNGAAPTLNVDSLGAKAINVASATAVGTGVINANSIWDVTYDNGLGVFILGHVPAQIQDSTVATASIQASAVTYAKIQNVTNSRLLGNNSGGAAAPSEISMGNRITFSGSTIKPNPTAPNIQVFTSGSATYTTPTDGGDLPLYLRVRMAGGGGGGGAASTNNGVNGGDTSFASWTAIHGNGGTAAGGAGGAGGTGGVNSTGTLITRIAGGAGSGSVSANGNIGTIGGSNPFGGAGAATTPGSTAGAAAANSGAGGAGALNSGSVGGSGGAGEYVEFVVTSPASSYSYTVGGGGTGGAAGGAAGGNGAAGRIEVVAYWQ